MEIHEQSALILFTFTVIVIGLCSLKPKERTKHSEMAQDCRNRSFAKWRIKV